MDQPIVNRNEPPWPVVNSYNLGMDYAEGEKIRVRALRTLYYDFLRRHEGDVFDLIPKKITITDKRGKPVMENGKLKKRIVTAADQFSDETMELVDESEMEKITTAQQALNKAQDELNESKVPRKK